MAKKARKRKAWTAEQVRTLRTMARQKKGASRIAKRLKRTEGATRQKAFSIGLSLDMRTCVLRTLRSGEPRTAKIWGLARAVATINGIRSCRCVAIGDAGYP